MDTDELAVKEFCQKMRGIGQNPEEGLQIAAMLIAVGMSMEEATLFARIRAQGVMTVRDLFDLARLGISTPFMEKHK